ncbi:MAG: hypothetical protein ACRDA5_07510, partial [Clostridium sp.]
VLNKKNTIGIIVFIVGALCINVMLGATILSMDYSAVTKIVLTLICIAFVLVGIFQIITKKIRFKMLEGRIWGLAFIIMACLISIPMYLNTLNKIILIGCNNDYTEAKVFKSGIINNSDDENYIIEAIEKVMGTYRFSKFDEVTTGLGNTNLGYFTYYYDNETSKESIRNASNAIEDFKPIINKGFEIDNSLKTDIVILNEFNDVVKEKAWVAGFVDPHTKKIYVLNMATMKARNTVAAYSNQTIDSFESVVVHEYTHKVIQEVINRYNISIVNIPLWFHEGLATYYENLYSNKTIENTSSYIGDLRINKNFRENTVTEYYERSAIVIKYLIINNKETVITDILEEMSKGNDIYEALKIVTGESFEDITGKVLL